MTTLERRGPGRPPLTEEQKRNSLVTRYWQYTKKVPGDEGCRVRAGAYHVIKMNDGSNIALFRVGWLAAHPEYPTVPPWIKSVRWTRTCWTSACVAGEHIDMEVPEARKPVLPPEAIAR